MRYPIGLPRPSGVLRNAADWVCYGNRAPLWCELIHIDPETIAGERKTETAQAFHRTQGASRGLVVDGDWDRDLKELNPRALGVYLSCQAHWMNGVPWQETPVYISYRRKIEKGQPHPDCPTLSALNARYAALDRIYEKVLVSGRMSEDSADLVTISFDRYGRAFWGPNGRHRVCIALTLGLREMPARVGIVHNNALDQYQVVRSHRRAPIRGLQGLLG